MVVTLEMESNMKKQYIKPEMLMVCIAHTGMICTSEITETKSNLDESDQLNLGDGYDGFGRARRHGVWEDDEEEGEEEGW